MWAFGFLCLLSFSAVLSAPQSSETLVAENEFYTSEPEAGSGTIIDKDSSEEGKEEFEAHIPGDSELDPTPIPSETEPENKPEFEEGNKENNKPVNNEDSGEEGNKEDKEEEGNSEDSGEEGNTEGKEEEDKEPESEKPGEVILEVSKPSFWGNIFSNFPTFSWPPSFPFSLPTFSFNWPFNFGKGQRMVLIPRYPAYPNLQYDFAI